MHLLVRDPERGPMKRVLVIGSGGAGKSALAVQLGPILGLPVIHLDRLYWKPGWQQPDRGTWRETVSGLITGDEWVMDGNYGGSLDIRIPAADTVIYLDFPPSLCLWRVIKRRFQHKERGRPDMAPGCPEQITLAFLKWIWDFRRDRRPRILTSVEKYVKGKNLIILKCPGEVSEFLREIKQQRTG